MRSGGSSEPDARTHPQSGSEELRDLGRGGAQHPRLHSSAALVALVCCEEGGHRLFGAGGWGGGSSLCHSPLRQAALHSVE